MKATIYGTFHLTTLPSYFNNPMANRSELFQTGVNFFFGVFYGVCTPELGQTDEVQLFTSQKCKKFRFFLAQNARFGPLLGLHHYGQHTKSRLRASLVPVPSLLVIIYDTYLITQGIGTGRRVLLH